MLQSSAGARWALRFLTHMRRTQALAYLQAANEGAEVVFGGDLNWIEEEQGELPLPGGWYALTMPRLQLKSVARSMGISPLAGRLVCPVAD